MDKKKLAINVAMTLGAIALIATSVSTCMLYSKVKQLESGQGDALVPQVSETCEGEEADQPAAEEVATSQPAVVQPPAPDAQSSTSSAQPEEQTKPRSASSESSPYQMRVTNAFFDQHQRLELSLSAAEKKAQGRSVVCMMHYPPMFGETMDTDFTRLLEKYHVKLCVYGHLHGDGAGMGFCGERNGIIYQLVSCDALDFKLLDVTEYIM